MADDSASSKGVSRGGNGAVGKNSGGAPGNAGVTNGTSGAFRDLLEALGLTDYTGDDLVADSMGLVPGIGTAINGVKAFQDITGMQGEPNYDAGNTGNLGPGGTGGGPGNHNGPRPRPTTTNGGGTNNNGSPYDDLGGDGVVPQMTPAQQREFQRQKDAEAYRNALNNATREQQAALDREAEFRGITDLYNSDLKEQLYEDLGDVRRTNFKNPTDLKNRNFDAVYTPTLAASLFDKLQTQYRNNYTNVLNKDFSPGFADAAIPSTFDDQIINELLAGEQGKAKGLLDNSFARGQLTDNGYSAALGDLGTQRDAAAGKLGTLGDSLLATRRQRLVDAAGTGFSNASGYTFGQNFNPRNIRKKVDNTYNEISGGLRNDYTAALPQGLFNPSTAINRGGAVQGPQNNAGSLTSALTRRNSRRDDPRGLGTQGSF